MIVVTGGAGFIGSAIVWELNNRGETDILIVDELGRDEKWKNLVNLRYVDFINKDEMMQKLESGTCKYDIKTVIHMGANSSTTEKDADHLISNNFRYTKLLSEFCVENRIRFVYASSAATYGDGDSGFKDNDNECLKLKPLNMYGYSKNMFDVYAFRTGLIKSIAGMKYFNVYGPNEAHKGEMRSVVHKAFEQIRDNGYVNLFKSLHPDYKDGEQKRDFIYVKDAVDMTLHLAENTQYNGLYNIGYGKAATWIDLVTAIFDSLGIEKRINFIDMPDYLAPKYQYFTEADIEKLILTGYPGPKWDIRAGVTDYVKNYLVPGKYLGE